MAEVTPPVADALELLGLDLPVSQEQLDLKTQENCSISGTLPAMRT